MRLQIIIPVYKPDERLGELLEMLKKQTAKNISVLILDSGSDKKYLKKAQRLDNVKIKDIDSREFNHGGTRRLAAAECRECDIYVYMTQDAIPADETAIEKLSEAFKNKKIGCAYGRQLPHKGAGFFAGTAREFNYPPQSYIRRLEDKKSYGIKTAFLSDSFAAYRKEALEEAGGFPEDVILGEDMYTAAKMLMKGWEAAYVAEARVYHSHSYTVWQEFRRYFDTGVFHAREGWLIKEFGRAEGEGKRFVMHEAREILKKKRPQLLIGMAVRDGIKYLGYALGKKEKYISEKIKAKLSMNKGYWRQKRGMKK